MKSLKTDIKDKAFEELKKENQKEIKDIYAIPKGKIIKDFEIESVLLTKYPMKDCHFIIMEKGGND